VTRLLQFMPRFGTNIINCYELDDNEDLRYNSSQCEAIHICDMRMDSVYRYMHMLLANDEAFVI
jgi:hypothetical protein